MVFDDVESFRGDMLRTVTKFRDQCLQAGRKQRISVIAISHELFDGHKTKSSLTECQELVLFRHGVVEPIERMLKIKFGLKKSDVQYALETKTRWFMIRRAFPQLLITPNEVKCL
jgi:hypothetical protein